jgi:EAL domain-containing protein (putative c-di-GMP-specific phosphodiesterase class I)/DNA-binding NarL/FixJ family response regulator
MEPIRVLVADDDPGILDVLVSLVASDMSMTLVGTARDAEEAIDLARDRQPDVAVLDARMPGGGGPRAARGIRRTSPYTNIVALSAAEDRATIARMMDSGASSYVSKGDHTNEILRAIRRSTEGRSTFSTRVRGDVAETLGERLSRARAGETRTGINTRIRGMLEGDGIHIVFQPIVDLRSGRIVAVEALARFLTRPRRSPEFWFAQAREHELGIDLELAAAARALEDVDRLPVGARLAINLSPEAICSKQFAGLLRESPLTRVIVEITEQTSVEDRDRLEEALTHLRAQGLLIAVDDVGAGFSSLSRVVELRPDLIKLDIGLVRGVELDPVRQALVQTLVLFSERTETQIVAEGIESDEQVAQLLDLGVELGQGFRLGRPGPLPDVHPDARLRWEGRHAFSDDAGPSTTGGSHQP